MLFATGANFAGAKVQQIQQTTKFLTKYFKKSRSFVLKSESERRKSMNFCKLLQLQLLALFHFQVAVDDIHAEVVGGGKQRQDAMLTEGGYNEPLLIDETVCHDLTIVVFKV
jgi:hypothetical protein